MSQTDLRQAFDAYYQDQARRAARRDLRVGDGARRASAQPLRYDESGFPIPARSPSVAERLSRLLAG